MIPNSLYLVNIIQQDIDLFQVVIVIVISICGSKSRNQQSSCLRLALTRWLAPHRSTWGRDDFHIEEEVVVVYCRKQRGICQLKIKTSPPCLLYPRIHLPFTSPLLQIFQHVPCRYHLFRDLLLHSGGFLTKPGAHGEFDEALNSDRHPLWPTSRC